MPPRLAQAGSLGLRSPRSPSVSSPPHPCSSLKEPRGAGSRNACLSSPALPGPLPHTECGSRAGLSLAPRHLPTRLQTALFRAKYNKDLEKLYQSHPRQKWLLSCLPSLRRLDLAPNLCILLGLPRYPEKAVRLPLSLAFASPLLCVQGPWVALSRQAR